MVRDVKGRRTVSKCDKDTGVRAKNGDMGAGLSVVSRV